MIRLLRSTISVGHLPVVTGFAIACQLEDTPVGPAGYAVSSAAFAIGEAPDSRKPHFFLLPPLAPQPQPTGRFNPKLAPTLEIRALLDPSACGPVIAAYTRERGPGGEVVRVDAKREWYEVNWKTRTFSLRDDVHYRIKVRVGAVELGYVDIDVARRGTELRILQTGEVIGLTGDGTLTIRFRAEEGIGVVEAPNTGKLAFVSDRSGDHHIYTMTGSGLDLQQLTNGSANHWDPVWSPDGTKITYARWTELFQSEIWVMKWDGSVQTNLSNVDPDEIADDGPVWSPDGTRIAFTRTFLEGNEQELFVMNADGTGQINLSEDSLANDHNASWSPDGTRIAFSKGASPYVVNADGTGTPTELPFVGNCGGDSRPAWSPSGNRIALNLDCDIYVVAPDGSELTNLTDNPEHEAEPQWAPDGSKLYFLRAAEGPYLGDYSIWAMNPDGTCQEEIATTGAFGSGVQFHLTSDGEWLAFTFGDNNEFETWEVFKIRPDGTELVDLTNVDGRDWMPNWRP